MKMKQSCKKPIIQIKTKSHSYFFEKYFNKLRDGNCVVQPLPSLCGGWYIETFKQVINKLSKNKQAPIPMIFTSLEEIQAISKNKMFLKKVFELFDTRSLGRIDASEVYCALLLLSKGSYDAFLKTIVDLFGFCNEGRISRNEFFFFIDSFYRALPKILINQGSDKPSNENNLRLQFEDIKNFVDTLFEGNKAEIERNEIFEQLFIYFDSHMMMKIADLNEFLKYLQKKCNQAAEFLRLQALNKMKIEAEVRNCVSDMVLKIHLQDVI